MRDSDLFSSILFFIFIIFLFWFVFLLSSFSRRSHCVSVRDGVTYCMMLVKNQFDFRWFYEHENQKTLLHFTLDNNIQITDDRWFRVFLFFFYPSNIMNFHQFFNFSSTIFYCFIFFFVEKNALKKKKEKKTPTFGCIMKRKQLFPSEWFEIGSLPLVLKQKKNFRLPAHLIQKRISGPFHNNINLNVILT